MSEVNANHEYLSLLNGIRERIAAARTSAARHVNRELILLYWDIGGAILRKQAVEGWGKSVVEQLSKDIQSDFPGVTGYSPQNLWLMRQFHREYTDDEILSQPVAEILQSIARRIPHPKSKEFLALLVPESRNHDKIQILQQLVREIPWGHNILIFSSVKDLRERKI